MLLLATVPLSIVNKSQGLNFPDIQNLFSAEKKAAVKPVQAKKQTVFKGLRNNSLAYVQALDQAIAKLQSQISKSPSDPALQNQLGMIYLSLADSESAEHCFINAVSLSRSNLTACAANVEKLKTQGRMEDASAVVLEASRSSIELSAAHSNLARVYDERGDRKKVIAQLDQISKDGRIFNGFAANASSGKLQVGGKEQMLSNKDAQVLAQAESLFKTNQLGPALLQYRKLSESNPKLAFVYDRIGLISVMTGDLGSGVEAWQKAAKLDPQNAAIANNLGLAYHQMGEDSSSESAYRWALKLDPSMEEACLNLGDMLSSRGDYAGACKVMMAGIAKNPDSARIANNLGSFLSLQHKYHEAIPAFRKAIHNDSNLASAHYGLGVALLKTHKYANAIPELKMALLLNPRMMDAQSKIEEAHRLAGSRL